MRIERTRLAMKACIAPAMALIAAVAWGQDFTLDWRTADGGGEMWCTGGEFELSGTIGQTDATGFVMTNGTLEVTGGFWVQVAVYPAVPGDFDNDGDVDLDDYAVLADCLAGPGASPNPSLPGVTPQDCLDAFDFDAADGDVDAADFSAFQEVFTGQAV